MFGSHMSPQYFYGATGKSIPKRPAKPSLPQDLRGKLMTGRIVKILVGQGHGFIRLPEFVRDVYFHRGDLQTGTAFNDLDIGDTVRFELLEDTVSGARALRVTRHKSNA
jgi:cold shock CspA family protein